MTAKFGPPRTALCLIVAASVLAACHRPASEAAAGPMFTDDHGVLTVPSGSPLRTRLAVQPVSSGDQAAEIALPAQVEADPARVTNVVAPLTGRVVAVRVRLGERVRRGQTLAVLASSDMAGAYADADKAADALDVARKALERAKGVMAAGGAAEKDLEAAQSVFNQAQLEAVRARARVTAINGSADARWRGLTLTAPQSGVVTALAVAQGQQVTDPTAVLMTVANVDQVFVTADVPESQVGKFRLGAPAVIVLTGDADHPLRGRISQIDAMMQADTRRQKVRIAMPNPGGRLLPNMYATVRLSGSAAGGVFVPLSALLMNNDAVTVLVETSPWVFQRRAVQIADETDTSARVLNGLEAGDRVVVKGGVLLDD